MAKYRQNINGKIRAITFILLLCFVLFGFFYPRFVSKTFVSEAETSPTPPKKTKTETPPQKAKYSEFSHSVSQHSKLACDSCHKFPSANWKSVRNEDKAFPDITDYPKHESCMGCHRRQFFGSSKPVICSICHTNPSPRNSTRHPFPNPREIFDLSAKGKEAVSDFAISFAHETHIEMLSQNRIQKGEFVRASFALKTKAAGEESCSVCHQTYQPQGDSEDEFVIKPPENWGDGFWLKKGTFKTVPTSHAKCFECHSLDTGIEPAPTNCAACHKLKGKEAATDFDAKFAVLIKDLDKTTLDLWKKRDSSATFRHEFSSHSDLECANCHSVTAMNTLDSATKKVPIASCNFCHITETADDGGILNYEIEQRKKNAEFQCVKCHIAFGKLPIPESHFKAIAAGN